MSKLQPNTWAQKTSDSSEVLVLGQGLLFYAATPREARFAVDRHNRDLKAFDEQIGKLQKEVKSLMHERDALQRELTKLNLESVGKVG